ncbi:MAG: LUD domain-containing protein [Bacteroidota bacterium]
MSPKEDILKNIRQSRKDMSVNLIEFDHKSDNENLINKFYQSLETSSASYVEFSEYNDASNIIKSQLPDHSLCVNTIDQIAIESLNISEIDDPKSLHPLDISIIRGEFGVAENGAIWVNAGELPFRILPFICENLVVILNKRNIVGDMHEAYKRTDKLDYSFGVFITGPSKTADIEQTLVVGAQGPRKMLVLIKDD